MYAARMRWRAVVLACAWLAESESAVAQSCRERAADWKPSVRLQVHAPTLIRSGAKVRASVWLDTDRCGLAYGHPRQGELRVRIVEGAGSGGDVPYRVIGGESPDLEVGVIEPGIHGLEVTSITRPDLVSAVLRFRVLDPARVEQTRLRLEFPRDRLPLRFDFDLTAADGMAARASAVRRGSRWESVILLEPGRYLARVQDTWLSRHAFVTLDGEAQHDVSFDGSRVVVLSDGLPDNEHAYELVGDYADGTHVRAPLRDFHTMLDDDLAPGRATVSLCRTRRVNPWNRDDPALHWEVLRTLRVDVPIATELELRWSIPSLLAGGDGFPRVWSDVLGRGTLHPSDVASSATALAVRAGLAVAIGGGVWEHRDSWKRWELAPDGPSGSGNRIAIAPGGTYAWLDDDGVGMRTRTGVAHEAFDTHDAKGPYPCYATGLAATNSEELVVVGRCRGNSPEDETWRPHEGFVAERSSDRWTVTRGFAPLRAVTAFGDRVIAVGDHGQVAVREHGSWRKRRAGDENFFGVATDGTRLVARTEKGALVELGLDGRALSRSGRERSPRSSRAVTEQCFAAGKLVAWYGADAVAFDEGERRVRPELVLVDDRGAPRVVHESNEARIAALACDGDSAWILVRDGGRLTLRQLALQ